jgi:WD40 repeat protein
MIRGGLAALPGAESAPPGIVIVVDQLEELFTLGSAESERREFISWLWRLGSNQGDGQGDGPRALVVCGVRADFYAACANYPQLRAALQSRQVFVGPMSQAELRQAIRFPAQVAGLEIGDGLVELLLRDLGGGQDAGWSPGGDISDYDAGRLPFLAHALQATWQQRSSGHVLTVDGYQATGGIAHAIATTADRCFSLLRPEDQEDARAVFLRLVRISDDDEDVRRPLGRAELLRASERPEGVQAVLDVYTASRLLTQTQDTVQITHEALIRAWPRLRRWINEDRAGNLIRQELEDDATAWDKGNRSKDLLHRGTQLDQDRRWAAAPRQRPSLSTRASEFLAASTRQRRRAARLTRVTIAVLAALAILAAVTAGFAVQQRFSALTARDDAVFGQVSNDATALVGTNDSLAAQFSALAYQLRPDPDTYTSLLGQTIRPLSTPLTGPGRTGEYLAFSPAGNVLATAGSEVQLWTTADPAHAVRLGSPIPVSGTLYSVALSPDGTLLATGGDGSFTVWDVRNPSKPVFHHAVLPDSPGEVPDLSFSADGRRIAVGTEAGTVQLWSVTPGGLPDALTAPLWPGDGWVNSVAFSADDRLLATGGANGNVRLWTVTDPRHPVPAGKPLKTRDGSSPRIVFASAGHLMATGNSLGYLQLWDVADPAQVRAIGTPVSGGNGPIFSIAFSPDDSTLASTVGTRVQLWAVNKELGLVPMGDSLSGYPSPVSAVAFGSDSRHFVAASTDGTTRLWTLPASVVMADTAPVRGMAFSPNGRLIATGSVRGILRLWKVTGPGQLAADGGPITVPAGQINILAFSPDGHTVAVGSQDGRIQEWDVGGAGTLRAAGPRFSVKHDGPVYALAFSPSGDELASAGLSGLVQLWKVADPAHPAPLGRPGTYRTGAIFGMAYSPNGRLLAIACKNARVGIWGIDSAGLVPIGVSLSTTSAAYSVAFSPDGRTLAVGTFDNLTQLWNVASPSAPLLLGQLAGGQAGAIFAVAFAPSGKRLATGSLDGTVQLWDVTHPARTTAYGHPLLTDPVGTPGVEQVSFSPDSQSLATTGGGGSLVLLPLAASQGKQWICQASPDVLTQPQWSMYVSGLPYDPPCGNRN